MTIYKVLLADDEILDLEGMLTFIPWDELGLKVVDAVNSGFSAYEVIEREKIDILVTDVHMPIMSGLELAKKALEKWKDLRVIFVSGYQDFNYVKQAISLNACSYVLKPMDDKELIDSLVKVRHDLDLKRKSNETELAYKQMIPMVKNEYMLQLLEGSIDSASLEVLAKEYGFDRFSWPGQVTVLEIDDLSWKLNPYGIKEKQELLNEFFGSVLTLCRNHNIDHVCKIAKQRIALLFSQTSRLSVLNDFIANTKDSFPFTVTAGIGGMAATPNELQDSYRQALDALEYKMVYGKGKLINFADIRTAEIENIKNLDIRLESLFTAITNYEVVRIYDELEKLFPLEMNLHSKFTIHNFTLFVIMKFDDFLHTQNEDLFQMLGMELQNLDILLQYETIDDIRSWLLLRAYEISETLHMKKQKKNWKLIHEIIESVKARLHENITLRDIADQFSFSPNYLGYLFKEEIGKNFSDYVISLRMEKARDLLKENKYKIYEVADKVGYRYLPYFSRQFKETYGMTPLEYQRKH